MREIAVEWQGGRPAGIVEVSDAVCAGLAVRRGDGEASDGRFAFRNEGPCGLRVRLDGENLGHGANPTMVTVRTEGGGFTVLLRDVASECPVLLPEYGVAVVPAGDPRCYEEIEQAARARGLQTSLQRIESEPEESYDNAAAHTRSLKCPTWLGLGRDMRIFELEYAIEGLWHQARPRFHGFPVPLPETGDQPSSYSFYFSRGVSCVQNVTRRLGPGSLPILHATLTDDDVVYEATAFASLERTELAPDTVRGTHYLVADAHGHGNMMTPEQKARYEALLPVEMDRDEETVLCHRVEATNMGAVPRYAWFKVPVPNGAYHYDGERGLGIFESGRAFVAAKLDGVPMPKEEVAVLLRPGETAVFDFVLAHRPVPSERADSLARFHMAERLAQCHAYWGAKLLNHTKVHLPEERVDRMLRAGMAHLDLVAYGLEPDGPVAATIGVYCPIGSESSPIIQAMDSFGFHKLAERSLEYFLDKQHDDGFIQNFGGYMLETGAALWSMGEHYRYTRDDAWLARIAPKLLKSCDYMLAWRERNKREDLRGRGYGMLEGKVADPEDPFHSFMLNGYAYLGLARAAEMLAGLQPDQSARLAREAAALKADIRASLQENMARSPVVPLRDGAWQPSVAPWAEARGPVSLLTDGEKWFTHGAFTARDSLIGPLYLILQEVVDPKERAADWLVRSHAELYHVRNVAPSQPYYSPQALAHLRRGEVKAFLKTYYNTFSGLADRETYTFWEHYFHASPHKTHEEGWFLMQTRWMLWLEDGDTLRLLPGIPRAWMARDGSWSLDNVATYFGPVSLHVHAALSQGRIAARITSDSPRKPSRILLRMPHPQGRHPRSVRGGTFDAATECVRIEGFEGAADVTVAY